MDSWLQRLVVTGPRKNVLRFRRDASSSEKPIYLYRRSELRTQRLSFLKLHAALPDDLRQTLEEPAQEPWDLYIAPQQNHRDGAESITYGFQLSRYECEDLITAVSNQYPDLCFVLGTVAPAGDEQTSLFAHRARAFKWRLPGYVKRKIFTKIPKETDDNEFEVFWAFVEADQEMMGIIVDHWNAKTSAILSAIRSPASRTSKKRRRLPIPTK